MKRYMEVVDTKGKYIVKYILIANIKTNKRSGHISYTEQLIYNHTTSNLAIYTHETSQHKLPVALNRQSIIVIQVHDKLHENLFISTFSFLWMRICLKKAYGEKLIY